jgi:hypothetical protein
MEVTHAHTVRIGEAHKCGVFEADGFDVETWMHEATHGSHCKSQKV